MKQNTSPISAKGNEPTVIIVQSPTPVLSLAVMIIFGLFSLTMTLLSTRSQKGHGVQTNTAVFPSKLNTAMQNQLHDMLDNYFSDEELIEICLTLGVDYEDLPAIGQAQKARELVSLCGRSGRLFELQEVVKELRPFLFEMPSQQRTNPTDAHINNLFVAETSVNA